ncbi:YraN family protein [Candidatus Avelusimicrobium luingense]|uniref:YraN family protein n=1 Tax=Candidatus Avelusimicrobium luingense TaxID=3416211 RepID=UPI003D14D598
MSFTRTAGQAGEEQAALFLTQNGYTILDRNFSACGGELDIVAKYKKMLVFVEVKARASMAFGGPILAVTPAKQRRIVHAALQYIKVKAPKFDSIRFDVVCVLPEKIEHIPNAFIPPRTTF